MSYQQNKKNEWGYLVYSIKDCGDRGGYNYRKGSNFYCQYFRGSSKKEKCLAIYNVVPKRSDMYCIWFNKWEKYFQPFKLFHKELIMAES